MEVSKDEWAIIGTADETHTKACGQMAMADGYTYTWDANIKSFYVIHTTRSVDRFTTDLIPFPGKPLGVCVVAERSPHDSPRFSADFAAPSW